MRRQVNRKLYWIRLNYYVVTLANHTLKILLILGCAAALLMVGTRFTSSATSGSRENPIVATLGSQSITLAELERVAAMPLYEIDQQRHRLLRNTLQTMIDERLLAREAAQRGVTVEQLFAQASRSSEVARLANLPAPLKRLSTAMSSGPDQAASVDPKEQARIRQAFLVSLRRQISIQIALHEPVPPILAVTSDEDPTIGSADAPVTIVEFSDFQCPYCKLSASVIREVLEKYPGQVKVVYRDYPGPNHPYAQLAAEAARCAGDQDQFWDYHDLLFSRQMPGSGWDFFALATELQLDIPAFTSCLESHRHREAVMKDLYAGLKLGISSTPTFFINGRPVVGARPFADIRAMIDPLLKDGEVRTEAEAR